MDGQPVNHHIGVSCFAEYAVVSRRSCVKVDKSLSFAELSLFGCAVQADEFSIPRVRGLGWTGEGGPLRTVIVSCSVPSSSRNCC